MLGDVIEKITNSKSAAILTHINEDADTLGSCFALMNAMKKSGRDAVVYVSDELDGRFGFFKEEYKVYADEPNPGHDLCICLDCGDEGRLGDRIKLFNEIGNSVNIDHHYTNNNFADVNYVLSDASSTGEIMCDVLKELNFTLDEKIAELLYAAICSDTGGFKYSNVSPKTMRAAADLLEFGIDHAEIARLLFDCHSFESTKLTAEVMQNIKSYCDGKIKLVVVTDELYKKYMINSNDSPDFVNIPRSVKGTEIAVCIKEHEGKIRINLRSNGNADVSLPALKFGGGGHKKAAGCSIDAQGVEEAEKLIVKACEEVL